MSADTNGKYLGLSEEQQPLYLAISSHIASNTQIVLGKIELVNQRLDHIEKQMDKIDKDVREDGDKINSLEKRFIEMDKDKLSATTFDNRITEINKRVTNLENDKAQLQGGWKVFAILGGIATCLLAVAQVAQLFLK